MHEFGLVWLSSVWFGVVEFEFGLVRFIFVFLEDDLKKNAIVDTFFCTLREDYQDRNNKSNII